MAGWGAVAKHIVPELPAAQLAALEEFRYTAVLYINVLLRQWRPIADLRLSEMWLPGGYCQNMFISDPLRVGNYRPEYRPDRPTVLTLHKNLYARGMDPEEQMTLTRTEMEATPFATYERQVREELTHLFGPWGFRAADDIVAITVNRWAHGYTFASLPGDRKPSRQAGASQAGPDLLCRRRHGRRTLDPVGNAGRTSAPRWSSCKAVWPGLLPALQEVRRSHFSGEVFPG